MKIIIAGSRIITEYSFVKEAVIDSGVWSRYGRRIEIVSGMANGVDTLAVEFAERNNLTLHKFPAKWKEYGKRAGYMRNVEMAEFADGLIAIWDGKSRGTKHMIDIATEKDLFVYVFEIDNGSKHLSDQKGLVVWEMERVKGL